MLGVIEKKSKFKIESEGEVGKGKLEKGSGKGNEMK